MSEAVITYKSIGVIRSEHAGTKKLDRSEIACKPFAGTYSQTSEKIFVSFCNRIQELRD
jgi:hypothetical protein